MMDSNKTERAAENSPLSRLFKKSRLIAKDLAVTATPMRMLIIVIEILIVFNIFLSFPNFKRSSNFSFH